MSHSDIWQRIKHEIEGHLVFRTEDEWGPLFVVDRQDKRFLYFGEPYEQSCIYRDNPSQPVHEYARAMLLALGFVQPQSALMLGLGGGTLWHAFRVAYPEADVTLVELRPEVVNVARHYFHLADQDNDQVIIADAKHFIRDEKPERHDLLFADMFYDNRMHPWQKQYKFFVQCRRVLKENGWLVINFDHSLATDDAAMHNLTSLFPTVYSYVTRDDNNIIFASPQADFDPDACVDTLKALEASLGCQFEAMYRQLVLPGNVPLSTGETGVQADI